MAGFDIKFLWFLGILAICAMSLSSDQKTTTMPVVATEDCQDDMRALEIECMYYMHRGVPPLQDPNHRCCKVVHAANIPCCCEKVTQKLVFPPGYTIEDMLDWNKVMHCLEFCGKPLAPGTQCGHFIVQPGPPPTTKG